MPTLFRDDRILQGLKPMEFLAELAARLKSCPDANAAACCQAEQGAMY
jgi:hypothetical protein